MFTRLDLLHSRHPKILEALAEQTVVFSRYWKASVMYLSLPEEGEESPDSVGHRTI